MRYSVGDKVRYVPNHAHGDIRHKDCEIGVVTSLNDKYIFVKYEKQHYESDGIATGYLNIKPFNEIEVKE